MTDALVRALSFDDADQALILYNELTVGPKAHDPSALSAVINHQGTQVFGAFKDNGDLAAMVTLHLLPNVLWGARPYGLIENVVTRAIYQRQGYGRQVMQTAIDTAWREQANKIMLMTGKHRAVTGFYEALGFSSFEKTAMVIRRT